MTDILTEINQQAAALPDWVHVWMNWILAVFVAAILFVKNHAAARVVLAVFALTFVGAFLIFYPTRNIHWFSLVHLLLWIPLLIYLYRRELRSGRVRLMTPYGAWLVLLITTVTISLLFDLRDTALVFAGLK